MPDITLKQIKEICENAKCDVPDCPFAKPDDQCELNEIPDDWDLKEIEKRING